MWKKSRLEIWLTDFIIIYPRHLFDSVRIFCNSSQASDAAIHWAHQTPRYGWNGASSVHQLPAEEVVKGRKRVQWISDLLQVEKAMQHGSNMIQFFTTVLDFTESTSNNPLKTNDTFQIHYNASPPALEVWHVWMPASEQSNNQAVNIGADTTFPPFSVHLGPPSLHHISKQKGCRERTARQLGLACLRLRQPIWISFFQKGPATKTWYVAQWCPPCFPQSQHIPARMRSMMQVKGSSKKNMP